MAKITNNATLETEVGNWLNRSDLSADIPAFIDAAEKEFAQDTRLRKLASAAFSITADDLATPADFRILQSWEHDGGTYYGPIEVVGADQIARLKAETSLTGVPAYAAIIDGRFRFAPAPDMTYATRMTYWKDIGSVALGTSWLFDTDPYIYLYGALVQASPFLKDDNRVAVWAAMLDQRIDKVRLSTQEEHFSGTMVRRRKPIG